MRSPLTVDLDGLFASADFLLRLLSEDVLSFIKYLMTSHIVVTLLSGFLCFQAGAQTGSNHYRLVRPDLLGIFFFWHSKC